LLPEAAGSIGRRREGGPEGQRQRAAQPRRLHAARLALAGRECQRRAAFEHQLAAPQDATRRSDSNAVMPKAGAASAPMSPASR